MWRHPRSVLVVDDQREWRGIDLLAASWMFASAVKAQSKAPRVGIMLPTCGLFPAALLALWQQGRVAVPINYLASKSDINHICADAKLDACITIGAMMELVGGLPEHVHPIRLDQIPRTRFPLPRLLIPSRKDDDLAVLLYTSGTSGKPKGVMLTVGNIASNIQQVTDWATFTHKDTMLGVLPQFHSFGLTILTLLPLVLGGKSVFTARFSPRKLLDLAVRHRPTAFIAIPSMYNALAAVRDAPKDAFSSLRYAVSGAEPLPASVTDSFFSKFGVRISEGYGLTETSPVANWCRPQEYRRGSVGQPVTGVDERIVSADGAVVAQGECGEIRIKGPNVMRGYYQLPEETAKAFDADGYFRTGDIGRFDSDGHLFITGRLKEMLIVAGENVFPREIEEVLDAHESVHASAVIGMNDASRGEVPIAFVEMAEGAVFNESALRSWCRDKMPLFKVPREIRVIPTLPRNPTGKIQRRALHALVAASTPTS